MDCVEEIASTLERLLLKFHDESVCGKNGLHWAECEAAYYLLYELQDFINSKENKKLLSSLRIQ